MRRAPHRFDVVFGTYRESGEERLDQLDAYVSDLKRQRSADEPG